MRRQGRSAQALEDAALAPDDEHDREPGEGGRGDAVAEDPGEQVGGALDALVLDPVAPVDRAEQNEDDHREEEGEEGELVAAPVQPLLAAKLMEDQVHSVSPPVSSR